MTEYELRALELVGDEYEVAAKALSEIRRLRAWGQRFEESFYDTSSKAADYREEICRLRGALQFLVDWHEQAVHDPEVLWEGFERGRRVLDGTDEGTVR